MLSSIPINIMAGGCNTPTDSGKADKSFLFTLKYGHGGFNDQRSPIGKLGGGLLAVTAQHEAFPIAFSFSGEYYTNSAEPVDPYEISDMIVLSCYYSKFFLRDQRLNVFAGPGVGRLVVPVNAKDSKKGPLINLEAGVNARVLWKFGLYAHYKYLHARKGSAIDFNEHILLVGLSFNFTI